MTLNTWSRKWASHRVFLIRERLSPTNRTRLHWKSFMERRPRPWKWILSLYSRANGSVFRAKRCQAEWTIAHHARTDATAEQTVLSVQIPEAAQERASFARRACCPCWFTKLANLHFRISSRELPQTMIGDVRFADRIVFHNSHCLRETPPESSWRSLTSRCTLDDSYRTSKLKMLSSR